MSYSPVYTITDKILNYVAQAEAARQIIENSLLIPKWERSFQSQALVRTVHHSIAIEGNELSLAETEQVINGGEINTMRTRDIKEIINYRDVVNLLPELADKELNLELVFKIHKELGKKILEESELGVLRKKDSVIVNSSTGDVVFDPPPSDEVESELTDLFDWDKSTGSKVHPLLRSGILHFEIVRIHPFVDLNGRSSRLIATWSLYRDGYDIRRFFSLEEYYDQDTKTYYEKLDSAHSGDLTQWLEYFTQGVAIELERIKNQVLELSRDRKLIQKLGQVALNDRQIQLIQYLERNDEIRNSQFIELFPKISDDTILRDLKDLIDKKIIIKKGRTKAARYILV